MLLPNVGCENNIMYLVVNVIFFYDINIYLRMGSPAPGVPPKSIDMMKVKKVISFPISVVLMKIFFF